MNDGENEREYEEAQASSAADPLVALLIGVARRLSVTAVDRLWIFPPRITADVESALVVVSLFTAEKRRRRVLTARYAARTNGGPTSVEESVTEHALAPADRIHRVIDGVLNRLDDDLASRPPRSIRIEGETGRWTALLEELAGD